MDQFVSTYAPSTTLTTELGSEKGGLEEANPIVGGEEGEHQQNTTLKPTDSPHDMQHSHPTTPLFHPPILPSLPTTELVMTLTTSSPVLLPSPHQQTIDVTTHNTLQSLALFQDSFRFKAIVFTDSPAIRSIAERLRLLCSPIAHTNPYGLPIVREMLLSARSQFNASFYGYMNSDILLNPGFFGFVHTAAGAIQNHRLPSAVAHRG